MKPLRSIAFLINASKPGAVSLARELVAKAAERGLRVKETTRYPLPRGFLRGWDACCVIGGDGTLLGAVKEAAEEQVPIIGVNRGSLGFLTIFSPDEARQGFVELLKGSFDVDNRAMLACSVGDGPASLALNDILIKDRLSARLIHLEVHADGELVTDYLCDGLIFATATGSTAYNMSAGGPILHPAADVVAMTPICPHTLSNRTIIFRDSVKLRVHSKSPGRKAFISVDGQGTLKAGYNETISIGIAKVTLPLAQPRGYSHFAVVRTKLKWSGGAVERGQA